MSPLDALSQAVPHLRHSFDSAFVSPGLTSYVFWMIICCVLTVALVLGAARKLALKPSSKFASMIELGYDFVCKDMGQDAIGRGYKKHMPFIASMFFFILICNIIGLIPGFKTPTGSLSINWALAIISFVYFNYYGIKAHGGWGYIKSIAPSGLPLVMVPIIWLFETISLILRALTLAVRLYGNMFAGHMVLGIFALATSVFLTVGIESMGPLSALAGLGWFALLVVMYMLEMLVACLQAYVFAILSAVYIGLATSDH